MKLQKVVKGKKLTLSKVSRKKLDKNKDYKFRIKAYRMIDGRKVYLTTSEDIHVKMTEKQPLRQCGRREGIQKEKDIVRRKNMETESDGQDDRQSKTDATCTAGTFLKQRRYHRFRDQNRQDHGQNKGNLFYLRLCD